MTETTDTQAPVANDNTTEEQFDRLAHVEITAREAMAAMETAAASLALRPDLLHMMFYAKLVETAKAHGDSLSDTLSGDDQTPPFMLHLEPAQCIGGFDLLENVIKAVGDEANNIDQNDHPWFTLRAKLKAAWDQKRAEQDAFEARNAQGEEPEAASA
ncbi:MAG: hypothetical protein AAF608_05135 [Pseudomonadota bacterium]